MPVLKHQIVVHPDLAGQLASGCRFTPYDKRFGFSWYLCPVTVAQEPEWLLVNIEFGYCKLVIAPEKTAHDIADAAIMVIECHLPDDRQQDSDSVSLQLQDISWHTAAKKPKHVAQRYRRALKLIRKCRDRFDVAEALERLNETPLRLYGRTCTPTEGLEGLLLELADNSRRYRQTTPWWKLQWHLWTQKQAPWVRQ